MDSTRDSMKSAVNCSRDFTVQCAVHTRTKGVISLEKVLNILQSDLDGRLTLVPLLGSIGWTGVTSRESQIAWIAN